MSDSESLVEEPASNIYVDTETLIFEVEKRPVLYDKRLKEYCDKRFKEQLWCEVFRNVLSGWDGLSSIEKQIKGKEVQKKWKNVKDCFVRELKQRDHSKKRRRYLYYDSLQFLLPCIEHRITIGNMAPQLEIKSEIEETKGNLSQQELTKIAPKFKLSEKEKLPVEMKLSVSQQGLMKIVPKTKLFEKEKSPLIAAKENNEIKEDKTPAIASKEKNEINEEKSFALMLVPMLKKLDEDQKHYAKVEILNVMKRARELGQPPP